MDLPDSVLKAGLVPTAAGELFYSRSSALIRELEDTLECVQRAAREGRELDVRFSTGVLRAFPSSRMPEETRDFLRQADCVVEETREEVLRHVLEGQADLGFLIGEEEDERLFRVPVERVPVVACLPGQRL